MNSIATCQYFGVCGGCQAPTDENDTAIKQKKQTVLSQLASLGLVPEQVLPTLTGPAWGYRHKARLSVKYVTKKEKVLVGFREKQGRYITDMTSCPVLHESVGLHLSTIADVIAGLSCRAKIPQIEVAIGEDKTALVFRHMAPMSPADLLALETLAKDLGFELWLQPGKVKSVYRHWPVSDAPERLHYRLPNFDLNFAFHPLDFCQVNPYINRQMVEQAVNLLELKETDTVLDLFCGLGNFTLPIAKQAGWVEGVEGVPTMVERAFENARQNQIENCDFYAMDLMQANAIEFKQSTYDKLLLDPPRSGAAAVLPLASKLNVKRLVYVSCQPDSFIKDANELVNQHQYRFAAFGAMDMFPHTAHIETMALFIRD